MPDSPAPPIAGRYRIEHELGRGGMGVVYQVQHLNTGERLALKLLLSHKDAKADALERFKREMRAPALIRSEHVVRVTDADVAPERDGALFLVMELLHGFDLERILRQKGPLSPTEVVWLLGQTAKGLERAHAVGVVHRDLKPENLFLHRRENDTLMVKLLDFGIARLADADKLTPETAKVTQSGAILGTPVYLSPEQAMGESSQVGPASDIWSVGVIAFELLTKQTYFQADSIAKLIGRVCFAPMVPPSEKVASLPPGFDVWFSRSCDRDSSKRWPSAQAQVLALAEVLGVPAAVTTAEAPPLLQAWLFAQLANRRSTAGQPAPDGGASYAPSRFKKTTLSEGRGQSTMVQLPGRKTVLLASGAVVVLALSTLIAVRLSGPPAQTPRLPDGPQHPVAPPPQVLDLGQPPTPPLVATDVSDDAPRLKTKKKPRRPDAKPSGDRPDKSPPSVKPKAGVTGYDPNAP